MRISDWSSDVCSSDLPLFLPADADIAAQLSAVTQIWDQVMKPAAAHARQGGHMAGYLYALPGLVAQADTLARMLEHCNARHTVPPPLYRGMSAAIGRASTIGLDSPTRYDVWHGKR